MERGESPLHRMAAALGFSANGVGTRNQNPKEKHAEEHAWPNRTGFSVKHSISGRCHIAQQNEIIHVVRMAHTVNHIPENGHVIQSHVDHEVNR